jgi:hypothetical protein
MKGSSTSLIKWGKASNFIYKSHAYLEGRQGKIQFNYGYNNFISKFNCSKPGRSHGRKLHSELLVKGK